MCVNDKLDQFYSEAESLLERSLSGKGINLPPGLLHDAIELNHRLIKLPFQTHDIDVELSYDVKEFWQGSVNGTKVALEEKPTVYHVDRTTNGWDSWDDWCREVVWYGNKKGAYLYGSSVLHTQLAGHF